MAYIGITSISRSVAERKKTFCSVTLLVHRHFLYLDMSPFLNNILTASHYLVYATLVFLQFFGNISMLKHLKLENWIPYKIPPPLPSKILNKKKMYFKLYCFKSYDNVKFGIGKNIKFSKGLMWKERGSLILGYLFLFYVFHSFLIYNWKIPNTGALSFSTNADRSTDVFKFFFIVTNRGPSPQQSTP